jgi:hypothetical protein
MISERIKLQWLGEMAKQQLTSRTTLISPHKKQNSKRVNEEIGASNTSPTILGEMYGAA